MSFQSRSPERYRHHNRSRTPWHRDRDRDRDRDRKFRSKSRSRRRRTDINRKSNFKMDVERIQKELEEINPADLMTSNEVFDSLREFDSTVEVIGYVDGIESPRIVGTNKQYKFFKFYLNNGNGRKIQVVAWNEVIDDIIHHILPNFIIHLDGVQARLPKMTNFNNGNVRFELLIRNNTRISNLGSYQMNLMETTPISVNLSDILNVSGCIVMEAYIKTNFDEIHHNKLNKLIGIGSVTDGTYKLEVHIISFSYDDYFALGISKGDKVQVTGVMELANPPYLLINDVKGIKKLNGHMPINALLKGVCIPTKRKIEEGHSSKESQNKKPSV
ncbi:PREDICTED: uncharacterized protein LOC105556203 isoform X2 [Vollenhovia emeryi]|nr:PREDICTED: uncharacterized protein LOC105556203 isoform X2 [Vollenhovia emeryi]XP_011858677.1 PREDICTED: uncharacterized protein LOC105556203 isoform X2 [Vollenhovia emeryi]